MSNQNRKTYDFNSVGQTSISARSSFVTTESEVSPIGIVTPLQLGRGSDGLFRMSKDLVTQVRDNFRNMLSTNWGERLMLHDFGANLTELAFELGSDTADLEAVMRIKATTEKYMPFIRLETFESFTEDSPYGTTGLALVGIRVTYTVHSISEQQFAEEVIIYSAG